MESAVANSKPLRLVEHNKALEFTILADVYEYRVEFTLYEINGYAQGDKPGVFDRPVWHRSGSDCWPDTVDTVEESEVYLHGTVNATGESNWHFDEQERTMLHASGRDDLMRFGKAMARCWDIAKERCPNWAGD